METWVLATASEKPREIFVPSKDLCSLLYKVKILDSRPSKLLSILKMLTFYRFLFPSFDSQILPQWVGEEFSSLLTAT